MYYDLVPGDVIRHMKFGEGTVVSVEPDEGDSGDALAVVDFVTVGRKRLSLMTASARIERVGGCSRRSPQNVLRDLQALGGSLVPIGGTDVLLFAGDREIPESLRVEVGRHVGALAELLRSGGGTEPAP